MRYLAKMTAHFETQSGKVLAVTLIPARLGARRPQPLVTLALCEERGPGKHSLGSVDAAKLANRGVLLGDGTLLYHFREGAGSGSIDAATMAQICAWVKELLESPPAIGPLGPRSRPSGLAAERLEYTPV